MMAAAASSACLTAVWLLVACSSLAQAQVVTLYGSGTTNVARYLNATIATLSQSVTSGQVLNISYVGIGSGAGKDNFIAGNNDFTCVEITMTPQEIAALNGEFYTIPFLVEAISFFHNIPAAQIGGPLNLTSDLIARILSRNITSWSNPDIAFLNPKLNANGSSIVVVHRQDRSSSTYTMSGYLSQTTKPGVWPLGSGATLNWTADTVAVNGSGGMSSTVAATPFSIGYMEYGFGQGAGLSEIALANAAGNYLDTTQADLLAALVGVQIPDPADAAAWSTFNLLNKPGNRTWPITTFGYALLRKNNVRMGEAGGLLVSFWQFVLGQQGQNATFTRRFGLEPVPPAVATLGLNTLSKLQLAAGADPSKFTYSVNGTTSNRPLTPVAASPSPASVTVPASSGALAQLSWALGSCCLFLLGLLA